MADCIDERDHCTVRLSRILASRREPAAARKTSCICCACPLGYRGLLPIDKYEQRLLSLLKIIEIAKKLDRNVSEPFIQVYRPGRYCSSLHLEARQCEFF